jgi:outer membrane protein OmpA-like peptidoglycan-associated protein
MGKDKRTHFWASYADLMTSLFFLMVVLFIVSIVELKHIDATPLEVKELKAERDSLLNLNSRMILRQKQYSEELDSMRYLANATQAHIDKINEINDATKNLNRNYFVYDSINKKHKLNFTVRFRIDDDQIFNISKLEREKLLSVGQELESFINNASESTPEVQYLLVIEGQASRDGIDKMDYNYDLSYRRAKNLKKYWDNNNIHSSFASC